MTTEQLQFEERGDAYLEWANFSGFRFFQSMFDSSASEVVGVIAQFEQALTADQIQKIESACAVSIPGCYEKRSIASFSIQKSNLKAGISTLIRDFNLRRIELATPVVSPGSNDSGIECLHGYQFDKEVLLGIIDHGCPFANPTFDSTPNNTRIWRLWDQNYNTNGEALNGSTSRPQPPLTNFFYGGQFSASALTQFRSNGDDIEVYRDIGMPYLCRAATHGAHVMDVFAGPVPSKARVSPNRNKIEGGEGDADAPPTWAKITDEPAATAPIVFVQLPTSAVEDPTGRWLGRYVLDGLHYIVQCAGDKTERIVVNLSWGPQTGPHDGSALLELAMLELTENQPKGRELAIVLPAGNSYGARAHAQFPVKKGCQKLTWVVPPGNESPSFLEVWWPDQVETSEIAMSVTAPDGSEVGIVSRAAGGIWTPISASATATWSITVVPHEHRCMALLALAPTFSLEGDLTACPGGWSISVKPIENRSDDVNIYVARSNPNMGGRAGGTPSYLLDENYIDKDVPRPKDPGDNANSLVKKEGTLNGIGTGNSTFVAGGFVRNTIEAAKYTSMGAEKGRKPDYSLPSDESSFLLGVLGGGVHGGSVTRLVGTSTAAPQLARYIANGVVGAKVPTPKSNRDPRLGDGGLAVIGTAVSIY